MHMWFIVFQHRWNSIINQMPEIYGGYTVYTHTHVLVFKIVAPIAKSFFSALRNHNKEKWVPEKGFRSKWKTPIYEIQPVFFFLHSVVFFYILSANETLLYSFAFVFAVTAVCNCSSIDWERRRRRKREKNEKYSAKQCVVRHIGGCSIDHEFCTCKSKANKKVCTGFDYFTQ